MINSYRIVTVTSTGARLSSSEIELSDKELGHIKNQVRSGKVNSVQEVILANVLQSLEEQDRKTPGESTPAWFNLGDCENTEEGGVSTACAVNAKYVTSIEVRYTGDE